MKTILVCNQKGGVGKSLVADEIAFSFERSGIPVSFYDLDTQGGTLHETHEADAAQVAVVDTPGALQEGLADWLKEADVVVIPTRRWPSCPSPRRSFRREPPASPWSSSTDAARLRRRRLLWWARCARLRGSRRNNSRSEALSIWTNAPPWCIIVQICK